MKLFIGTAFYALNGYVNYILSLMPTIKVLEASGIEFEFKDRSGDAYVDLAKNALVAWFYNKTDCTDILLIDSDMGWDAEGFAKLLAAPVDIVAGSYPMKNGWEKYCGQLLSDINGYPKVDETTGLIEAAYLPGGFLRMTRRAVERMYKAFEKDAYIDHPWDIPGVWLFDAGIRDGKFEGEDLYFSRRWKALGEKLWIEPRINFSHVGVNAWYGNLDKYLTPKEGETDGVSLPQNTAVA